MLDRDWDAPSDPGQENYATHTLTDGPFVVNLSVPREQRERPEVTLEEAAKAVSPFGGDPAPYSP